MYLTINFPILFWFAKVRPIQQLTFTETRPVILAIKFKNFKQENSKKVSWFPDQYFRTSLTGTTGVFWWCDFLTLTLPFPRFEPWSRNVFVSTVHNGWKKCFTQNVAWSYLIFEISIDDQYLILIWFVVDFWVFCPRYLWPLFSFATELPDGWKKGSQGTYDADALGLALI